MKEYKYTINGNKYEVAIGEIVDNLSEERKRQQKQEQKGVSHDY